jgi:hypothetical protein
MANSMAFFVRGPKCPRWVISLKRTCPNAGRPTSGLVFAYLLELLDKGDGLWTADLEKHLRRL